MDVTRAPWCFPNLGGLTIDPGLPAARGRTGSSGGDGAAGSVWHAHYYVYPRLSWIGALLDLGGGHRVRAAADAAGLAP